MDITQALPIVACAVSFIVAGGYSAWIMRQNPGTSAMQEISEAVRVGAAAFLRREMKIIIPIAIGLACRDWFFYRHGDQSNGIAFRARSMQYIQCRLELHSHLERLLG